MKEIYLREFPNESPYANIESSSKACNKIVMWARFGGFGPLFHVALGSRATAPPQGCLHPLPPGGKQWTKSRFTLCLLRARHAGRQGSALKSDSLSLHTKLRPRMGHQITEARGILKPKSKTPGRTGSARNMVRCVPCSCDSSGMATGY